ncbi:MAG: hypothetical protein IT373_00960 [Polyangiaceae bacterium]|nr:hypothetical protein [Polyangiaceae bacterium]
MPAPRPLRADVAGLLAAARGEGMCIVRASLAPRDVVYFVSVLEAAEGVASVLAERGGELSLVCDTTGLAMLEELLCDVAEEIELAWRLESGGAAPALAPRAPGGGCDA